MKREKKLKYYIYGLLVLLVGTIIYTYAIKPPLEHALIITGVALVLGLAFGWEYTKIRVAKTYHHIIYVLPLLTYMSFHNSYFVLKHLEVGTNIYMSNILGAYTMLPLTLFIAGVAAILFYRTKILKD